MTLIYRMSQQQVVARFLKSSHYDNDIRTVVLLCVVYQCTQTVRRTGTLDKKRSVRGGGVLKR
jgi:hypothetical protein